MAEQRAPHADRHLRRRAARRLVRGRRGVLEHAQPGPVSVQGRLGLLAGCLCALGRRLVALGNIGGGPG